MKAYLSDLASLLTKVPTRRMRRRLYRCVPFLAYDKGKPRSFLYTSGRPNRCNPRGVSCLYFSEDARTADVECRQGWRSTTAEHQPKMKFIAAVSLRKVLDLNNAEARRLGSEIEIAHFVDEQQIDLGEMVEQLPGRSVGEGSPADAPNKAGD